MSNPMFTCGNVSLADSDPEVADLVEREKNRQWRGIELIASEVCRKLVPRRDQSHAALRASLECSRRAAAHARHTLRRALSAVSAHRGHGSAATGWRRTWGTASRASVFRLRPIGAHLRAGACAELHVAAGDGVQRQRVHQQVLGGPARCALLWRQRERRQDRAPLPGPGAEGLRSQRE